MRKRIMMLLSMLCVTGMIICGCGTTPESAKEIVENVKQEDELEADKTDEDASDEEKEELDQDDKDAEEEKEEKSDEEYSSYKDIYKDYAKRIKDATPGLIKEYKKEAKKNKDGLTGLAEISNKKISELAEISVEGTEKMANFMMMHGTGKYEEYEEWAGKLNDVYMEESQKITDAYMKSAM